MYVIYGSFLRLFSAFNWTIVLQNLHCDAVIMLIWMNELLVEMRLTMERQRWILVVVQVNLKLWIVGVGEGMHYQFFFFYSSYPSNKLYTHKSNRPKKLLRRIVDDKNRRHATCTQTMCLIRTINTEQKKGSGQRRVDLFFLFLFSFI